MVIFYIYQLIVSFFTSLTGVVFDGFDLSWFDPSIITSSLQAINFFFNDGALINIISIFLSFNIALLTLSFILFGVKKIPTLAIS